MPPRAVPCDENSSEALLRVRHQAKADFVEAPPDQVWDVLADGWRDAESLRRLAFVAEGRAT